MEDRLYVTIELQFAGTRENIRQTLEQLGKMLGREVEVRAQRHRATGTSGGAEAVGAPEYLRIVGTIAKHVARVFADSQTRFEQSASAEGSPLMFRLAYASLLDGLLQAEEAFGCASAPASMRPMESAFAGILHSIYDQVAAWPDKFDRDAANLQSDSYQASLRVSCDLRPYYQAIS